MRFGLSDAFLPERMDGLTAAHVRRVRELGFSGIFTRFTDEDPHAVGHIQCRRVRELLAFEGVTMFQATGYRPTLVHPDETARRAAVRTLRAALRIAGQLGAHSIDTGPGSLSPNGPWCPDPFNFTPLARDQLVKSLLESVSAAEEHGVLLCIEGHQLVTLRSAEVAREVVDAVDSRWLRVDFDPVNWITLETVYESGAAIERMVATLGDRIATSHVKDIRLRDTMVVHLDHCAPGQGMLDTGAHLRCMERLDPALPVIVEAATTEELPGVTAFLRRVADENEIEVLE